ncbi:MAG TPA: DUF1232 domain-containing protein [Clostridiales bacterium]|jgi:uncharacterized membrane protein YkvA (DUF1232 family)|nr:DUF1232 domain-containing protein [Clostridiales bacterium]
MKLKDRVTRLMQEIPVIYLALRHPRTPASAKLLAVLTLAYALSPIDLIPDFIPILGYLDELIILPILIAWTVRGIPQDVLEECRREAVGLWPGGGPKLWYLAVPIVLFWIVLIGLLLRAWLANR